METVQLRPTALQTTRLGFGCGGLMRTPSRRERQRLLHCVLDQGVRHFDTARMYGLGAAETELGRFLKGRRDDVVIATKYGIEVPRGGRVPARLQVPARKLLSMAPAVRRRVKSRADDLYAGRQYDVASARDSLETSLRELGTDYVDLFLVHGPSRAEEVPFAELSEFMEGARDKGYLKAWGVSGGASVARQVHDGLRAPAILQVHDDLFSREPGVLEETPPAITFGPLAGPLERFQQYFADHPDRQVIWTDALGADPTDTTALASLLLRDALAANPTGALVFGTSRCESVVDNVRTAQSAPPAHEDEQLAAFRRLVNTDFHVHSIASN